MDSDADFAQLVETFRVLEEACAGMYELMTKEKERLDRLEDKVTFLWKKA